MYDTVLIGTRGTTSVPPSPFLLKHKKTSFSPQTEWVVSNCPPVLYCNLKVRHEYIEVFLKKLEFQTKVKKTNCCLLARPK